MSGSSPDLREIIERVKERSDIESVIGRRVPLQRRGSRLLGLCPFHPEKTPSFSVSPEKGFYKCFGCGKGGDVISFLQEIDGLDFMEALRLLAEEAGVEVPSRSARGPSSDLRRQMRDALARARALYREALAGPVGEGARAYLAARGVEPATQEAFSLGWAPAEPGWLQSRLRKDGFSEDALLGAGLVFRPEGGGGLRDRFWERLLFPVHDRAGRCVGFGGRYLPGSRAEERRLGKYVNSPEGPLFAKRRLLFGIEKLAEALRHAGVEEPLLVCEGYLDVLMLHQIGLRCTVAAQGTSLTEEHARALRRFDRPVVLLLDPDEAGRKAAARAGRILVGEGIPVRVAELPEGQDPADLIAGGKAEELHERLRSSWDILDWRLETWSRRVDFRDPALRSRAAREAAEWIRSTPDPVLRELWMRRAGERLGLTEESLRRLASPKRPSHSGGVPEGPEAASPSPSSSALEVLARNEKEILSFLLHDPSLYPRFRSELDNLELRDACAKRALKWCQQRREKGLPFNLNLALEELVSPEDQRWLSGVRLTVPADSVRALESALEQLPALRESVRREDFLAARAGSGPSDEDLARYLRKIPWNASDERL